ncbi:MICAL-like protein 2 isoform X4 [Gadus macrocephalus]|uniref:MICAL-like protein 2 isoform X4 n=1 Tax=Gadus macrocephalus TaxID=80720 RepID=UPI0028CB879E|nr:MICAL-like protein 2 isoform X4 [Gadus macrocephalus]
MSAVKGLQQWCKIQCNGYRDVSITNMTTSFRDGLAFCAMIHKHRPDLIDFDSLKKNDVFENNQLAFRVAEEELGIPALLDAEDMVALKVPDRLSILTYVSQYYNYFHGRSPIGGLAGIKRPAEISENEPSGKKNLPVVAKSFPASKPEVKNGPPPSSSITIRGSSPARPSPAAQKEAAHEKPSLRQTGTQSNKCVSCNKLVHLVQRHMVDGKLYHRSCAKSTLKANAPLRDLLQQGSSSNHKSRSETPEPGESTSAPFSSDSSWLTTKKPPSSSPGLVSSQLNNKTQPSSSPSPSPFKSPSKVQPSSSPSPSPSALANKTQRSSSPSPSPSALANKTQRSSSPSPSPSALANKTQRSSSPSPSPSALANKTQWSSSPSPSPSALANKIQRSSSPSPSPSALANKTQRSSSPSPSPSALANKTQRSSSPSPSPSALANKTQRPSSPSPAPSWITKKPVSAAPPSTSGPALITKSTTGANKPGVQKLGNTTTYNTSISKTISPTPTISTTTPLKSNISTTPALTTNTSIDSTPVRITINHLPMETTPNPSRPTAAPRSSLSAQRTQQAKDRFLQKEPEGAITAGSDIKAATKESPGNKWLAVSNQGSDVRAEPGLGRAAKGWGVGGGNPDGNKNQAAALISRKLAKESNNKDTKPTLNTERVSEVETPKKDPLPSRGRVKLKVSSSILADLQTPIVDRSPDRASSASSRPWQADPSPQRAPVGPATAASSPGNQAGPESSEGPAQWRSKLKQVAKDTKISDPNKPSPEGKSPASVSSKAGPNPATSGFKNGSRAPSDNGTRPEPLPTKKPDYIPKEKIMEELQEIEDGLNALEKRGVELEKKLRRSEEEGVEDAAMDEVMVDWFSLIREKQVAMRRESELVYIAKTQDLEEQQPSVEQELRSLMAKPDSAKTSWERQREQELMVKLVEIVNDRSAIVDSLDEDRLREEDEDVQLEQMMMNLDIKKDKTKKKSPIAKMFLWRSNSTKK